MEKLLRAYFSIKNKILVNNQLDLSIAALLPLPEGLGQATARVKQKSISKNVFTTFGPQELKKKNSFTNNYFETFKFKRKSSFYKKIYENINLKTDMQNMQSKSLSSFIFSKKSSKIGVKEKTQKTFFCLTSLNNKVVNQKSSKLKNLNFTPRLLIKNRSFILFGNNIASKNTDFSFLTNLFEKETTIETQRKSLQKKRRRKKLKKETRRRKKRKRFYPRPNWLRFRFYLKLLKKRSYSMREVALCLAKQGTVPSPREQEGSCFARATEQGCPEGG